MDMDALDTNYIYSCKMLNNKCVQQKIMFIYLTYYRDNMTFDYRYTHTHNFCNFYTIYGIVVKSRTPYLNENS